MNSIVFFFASKKISYFCNKLSNNYVIIIMRHVYKGFIGRVKDVDEVALAVKVDRTTYFTKIGDPNKVYDDLKLNSIRICLVEFKDGTNPINFDLAKKIDHFNVFPWILNIADIESKFEGYLIEDLKKSQEKTIELWGIIDEVLKDKQTIKNIRKYKKITKKWVETH